MDNVKLILLVAVRINVIVPLRQENNARFQTLVHFLDLTRVSNLYVVSLESVWRMAELMTMEIQSLATAVRINCYFE